MKNKKWIIIGVAVLVIIIIVLNLRGQDIGKEVEVAVVKKGEIISKVSATGQLKAKAQVDVTAEIIAKVKNLYFKEGSFVKKGDLIIRFDDVQASANYKLAEVRLRQAEQDFSRAKTLFDKGLISKGEFEQLQLNFETTKAQYDQAHDTYQKTRIYAPMSGRIMKLNIEEGETAVMGTMNYAGTVLATIADLSKMIAIVKIDETEVPLVRVGQPVEIVPDALPDSTYMGKVTRVGLMPIVTSQLSTEEKTDFEVEMEMENFSPVLRPGMNVNTNIITNQKNDVLVVPIQAVGSRKLKDTLTETVYAVKQGKAKLTKIKIGVSSDTDMEIMEGLAEGDTIISGPYRVLSKLKDNEKIKYKPAAEKEKQTIQTRSALRFFRRRA